MTPDDKHQSLAIHMTLRKFHALSAILITAFACLHIANHLVGLSGVASHIAFMEVVRPVYRFPPVEFAPYYFLAVIALFTHLGCAAYWQAQDRPRITRVLVVAIPAAVGAVASLLIVLSLAGALFPLQVPAEYKATYAPPDR